MEIKPTNKPGYEAKLVFSGLDVKVMSAMAIERMHKMAMDKELRETTELDIEIARWARRRIRRPLFVADLNEVAEWLTEFANDTDAIVEELPDVMLAAAYTIKQIPDRTELGKHALTLAAQLNDETVDRFAGGDFDEAVAGLLDDSSSEPE